MWNNKKVSVVLPAYNEEDTVFQIAKAFKEQPYIDEVLVIDNNSKDRTGEEAAKAGARVIKETRQGYGFALQRGMQDATGDLVILSESDGNFYPRDTLKLLAYADDFDFVKGTRTRTELYEPGMMTPFMAWFLNVGNILVSKLTQFLYWGPVLTDAGCTMRLLSRQAIKKILPHCTVGGQYFLSEMTVLCLLAKIKTIEVPVHYGRRLGGYSKSGNVWGLLKIGFSMIGVIFRYRIISLVPGALSFKE